MKSAGKYGLCFMLIAMMLLAVGCGCGNAKTTEDRNQTGDWMDEAETGAEDLLNDAADVLEESGGTEADVGPAGEDAAGMRNDTDATVGDVNR